MVLWGLVPSSPAVNVLVLAVATSLVWVGSGWLEESAENLASYYGLPAVVQGSIVVAVGSSFPELASVVFAALASAFDIGVGAVVGSAIFNILVIPALSGLAANDDLAASRAIVYKEAQFYMLAVSALVVTLALAVIYAPVAGPALDGDLTRPLVLIPLLLYGLYIFIQWQDVSDADTSVDRNVSVRRAWATLAAGLFVILVAVEQLVGSVESLGHTFGVPQFLLGVTVVAAATSLPDTLVSVQSARGGNGATSLGNVFGSNTFDLLVAVPIGVLLVGAVPVNFAVAVPMFAVLTLATILLFTALRTDLSLTTFESAALLAGYVVFVAWIVAETLGVTSLIKGT